MERNSNYIDKQLGILEALIEVLPRESYIRLYDILNESRNSDEAIHKIMDFFEFSEEQAAAVYDLRITAFSFESVEEIKKEYLELKKIQSILFDLELERTEDVDYSEGARPI